MNTDSVRETDHTLTRQNAADRLGISLSTLDRRIKDGTLGSTRYINREVRVSRGDVARYAVDLPGREIPEPEQTAPVQEPEPVPYAPKRVTLRDLREGK